MTKKLVNRVVIIDGSMLIHKSQHVFKRLSVKSSHGTIDTGITYGFLRAVVRLNKLYEPCEMCVVFDNSMNITSPFKGEEKSIRQEILPEYKADRSHNTDLLDGVRLLFRFLKLLPVTIIYPSVKYEADDLVSFLVRKSFEDHMTKKMGRYEVIIVSDDKDFNQLIHSSNGFSVVLHKKNDDVWDEKKFRKKFGFSSGMFVPYLALLGDKGDNIPGVYGYGKVKAAAMVRDIPWNKISGKLSEEECIIFLKNMALISLCSEDVVVSKIYQPSLDIERFNRLAKKYKMMSFLRKGDQEIIEIINKISFLEGTK